MARVGLSDWQCVFANDFDDKKGAAYKANFGARELKVCDVANLTSGDLPDADLDWMSPPCQDLSEAGKGAGLEGASSNAFWPCVRLLKALRAEKRAPKLIAYENVTGLLSSSGGKDFDAVCDTFVELGYRIGATMIDAARFVPQSRERIFIVAIDAAVPIPVELVADRPSAPFHPPGLVKACSRQRSAPIWWSLPIPPARNTVLADLIEDPPTGVSWHTQAETHRLMGMMAPVHLAKLDEAKRTPTANRKRMIGGLYRRIRPDGVGGKVQRAEIRFDDIAGCLRIPSGGSSRQTIMIVEGASVRSRLLSSREAARLMGLPDSYKLPGNYNDAYGLMGDGVCVNVVRHLAQYILEPILRAEAKAPVIEIQRTKANPLAATITAV
jgi:DNA (cytosine-5)-methyltransferase 1